MEWTASNYPLHTTQLLCSMREKQLYGINIIATSHAKVGMLAAWPPCRASHPRKQEIRQSSSPPLQEKTPQSQQKSARHILHNDNNMPSALYTRASELCNGKSSANAPAGSFGVSRIVRYTRRYHRRATFDSSSGLLSPVMDIAHVDHGPHIPQGFAKQLLEASVYVR